MRIPIILAAVILAAPITARAQSQSVQKVLQDFGLIGVWANSCVLPADGALGNFHSIYALSQSDGVLLTYEAGPKYSDRVYQIVSAKQFSRTRLQYVQEKIDTKSRATVTVHKRPGGVITIWSSVTADGKVLVKQGKFAASGQASPRQTRCQIESGQAGQANPR